MLSDTHPEAERVQIELLRRMSVAQRIASMRSMTTMAIRLSRRAIAEAEPELTPEELDVRWVEVHYGSQLAAGFREYLSRRDP